MYTSTQAVWPLSEGGQKCRRAQLKSCVRIDQQKRGLRVELLLSQLVQTGLRATPIRRLLFPLVLSKYWGGCPSVLCAHKTRYASAGPPARTQRSVAEDLYCQSIVLL